MDISLLYNNLKCDFLKEASENKEKGVLNMWNGEHCKCGRKLDSFLV